MKEIAVSCGRGGAGRKSIAAGGNAVPTECDAHGADLHTVLKPPIRSCENFLYCRGVAGREKDCARCGACLDGCQSGAVIFEVREAVR